MEQEVRTKVTITARDIILLAGVLILLWAKIDGWG